MKKTKTPTPKNTKWYLVYDGKDHKVTNALKEYETLNVVVIELSPQQIQDGERLRKNMFKTFYKVPPMQDEPWPRGYFLW